jgi:hypothetical protein
VPAGQQYATNVPQTFITGQINATATTMSVQSSSGWPNVFPFTAILEIGTGLQEPIDVTNITGTTWTIVRAIDGTAGFTHQVNATVTHGDIGRDFREARSHLDAHGPLDVGNYSVHGLSTGVVVGTSETQTLTNKTINAGTFIGNQAMGTGAWTGGGTVVVGAVGTNGLIGAAAGTNRFVGQTNGGPPTSGTFQAGDMVIDNGTTAVMAPTSWICTTGGTPGNWSCASGMVLFGDIVAPGGTGTAFFSSIPNYFKHIHIKISAQSSDTTAVNGLDTLTMRFNNDSSANYNWNSFYAMQGAGVSTAGGTASTNAQVAELFNNHFTTPGVGVATIDIYNYANTTFRKVFTSHSGATDAGAAGITQNYSGGWNSTAAINRVTFVVGSGNLVAGSRLTMYLYS